MPNTSRESVIVGMLMCALCMPAVAQPPSTSVINNTPGPGQQVGSELYAGESDDVGPQLALSAKPYAIHVEASGDVQYYHTSNMFLYENSPNPNVRELGASVRLATVDLAVAPDPAVLGEGDFQPRLGYRQQWYSFNREKDATLLPPGASTSLDFSAQTLFVDARYRYHRHWILAGGVERTQLSMTHGQSNIYSEVVPRWSVQRQFQLSDRKFLIAGYQGAYHSTTTEGAAPGAANVNDRVDQALFVNYTQAITPQLFVKPYYQYKFTRYAHYVGYFGEISRHENLHTVGVTGSYYFIPQISLRAFASYDMNDSSAQEDPFATGLIYDYKKLDAGIALNVNYRF